MSEQLQLRRGPSSVVGSMIGAQGEPIVDTTNNRLTIHDGVTAGGWPCARLGDMSVGPLTGALTQSGIIEAVLTLSGSTVVGPAFPINARVLGVGARVYSSVTGATAINLGIDTGSSSAYWAGMGTSAGTAWLGMIGIQYYWSTTHLTINAASGTFTGGSVKVSIHYITLTPPV